jgi:type I restriction-modification system DNA methylase subunit
MVKSPEIGKYIDNALTLIEAENPKPKGILDKRYARAQLPDGKLGELVDIVSSISLLATTRRRRATCWVRFTNTSSASSPALRARRAGSSKRPPAASRP